MAQVQKSNLWDLLMMLFVVLFAVFCVIPMVLSVAVSFSDEASISRYGYLFVPSAWSTEAYRLIFAKGSRVLSGFGVSTLVTVIGTLAAVVLTMMAAYAMANKNVRYRGVLALYFFITMSFGAGIVPWYLVCQALGLRDNLWALIVPSLLVNPFNIFLARNFLDQLPESLRESATLDGANDVTICFRIYMPLAVPVIATIALFYALAYWNDWWNAIMLVEDKWLYPLQYMLLQIRSQVQMIREMQTIAGGMASAGKAPSESLKMATSLVTIGPIVLLYPFLQKYFVKGLVMGAVKG